ncbi:(2R)-3-sulfolactate dehydrogenase (NADP+) [Quadrisphaera granulorum]|uniref:(2R)-3-sulfolactate dehydrogenase (NADP+) n=1 Tax=Quadrisphaera granulorum TaxID=317664 RepID=A0A316A8N6_9ACTN|nr:Ldh family oxidoreductase [Quadrisphaera granulorum]PWJ53882.1 (2R)-3-sulfolactate dehydrogenase (NADP+) [Quadrisphaera granulorum]SZE96639.1 (2R)-3-sulfolactate dehydrogenase (NADP+) [Quadrisphaera granulorum]
MVVSTADLVRDCHRVLTAAGASPTVARLITENAIYSEERGHASVGVSHLLDHVHAMREGRLDGSAEPAVTHPLPAIFRADARGGVPHTAFDALLPQVVATAHAQGLVAFAQSGAYTCGSLGWFTHRLAEHGLVAIGTATSPALMAAGPGGGRVFGTNPMAFSFPRVDGTPLTLDQASSAVAWVRVREAAARGEQLPTGWALDPAGEPTTDPSAGLVGALLPFGGYKGANIALMVELLSCMAGGAWSMDAAPFDRGAESPAVGTLLIAIDPTGLDPDYTRRSTQHLERLAASGVRVPAAAHAFGRSHLTLPSALLAALRGRTARA